MSTQRRINFGRLGYTLVRSGGKKHVLCTRCNTLLKVITTERLQTHRNMCDTGQRKNQKEWRKEVVHEGLGCAKCNKVMKSTAASSLGVHRNKCQCIKVKRRQLKIKSNIESLGFVSVKLNGKHNALCTICNKIMKNTTVSRLEIHRKKCKYVEKMKQDLPTRIMPMSDFEPKDQKEKTKNQHSNNATNVNQVIMDNINDNLPLETHPEIVVIEQADFSDTPQYETGSIKFQPPLVESYSPLKTDLYSQAYDDDNLSFGSYVASKLKAFNDPYIQAIAKHHINRVIFNIELKQCELINKDSLFKHAVSQIDKEPFL